MIKMINHVLEIETIDSDDQGRSRLLSLLLLGTGGITILAILALIFDTLVLKAPDALALLGGSTALLLGIGACYWLNRRGKVILASSVFLTTITGVLLTVVTPIEAVQGRALFMFVIPILMASFVIRPFASFIVTGIIAILHIGLAFWAQVPGYQPFSVAAFLVIALVAYLAARNLEIALVNLQQINQDLDIRVNDRTRELANANQLLEHQTYDLAVANERLQDLDKLKSKFVSDVSHELRTPISNLKIYLEMMEAGNREKNERYLNVLRDETDRLEKLITDILNLSRMETGSAKVEYKWVDLNGIAERVVLANNVRAHAKNLPLTFEPDPALPEVWADANQLNQVINNLVGNAVNYTEYGSIVVRTYHDSPQNRVALCVQDSGMGIAEGDLPHLFERFYRGQQTGQSTIPGTGLGLAITQEIINRHKGSMEVQSTLGVGSAFTVYFPTEVAEPQIVIEEPK